MSNPDFTFPRETQEPVYFKDFVINGQIPVQAEYALTRGLARPTIWAPLSRVGGRFAFQLSGALEPGKYRVWARSGNNPQYTVVEVGEIEVT